MRFFLLSLGLLAATVAHAQQPVLPGAPQPGTPLPPTSPVELPTTEIIGHPGEVVGQTYSVETVGGILFNGTLRAADATSLTFETRELGLVTIARVNMRQLVNQTPEQARRGFDYVGNGTQMFLTPTARNLHQGEGSVQVIDIFLAQVDYGLTDNVSVGALLPIIPFVGIPVVVLTPKASVPLNDKLRVGAGVFYGFATGAGGSSGSAGIGYGLATYGTADTNLTFGLGYGFSSEGRNSTPVGVIGGNVRISRSFSLVNETYLASIDKNSNFGGLGGLRYASPRFSASLGLLYYVFSYTAHTEGGLYPAYLNAAFRFGKVKLK